MKRIPYIIGFLLTAISVHSQDTTIYSNIITINSDLSSYDNVEIVADSFISLSGGFYYSSDGTGEFKASADVFSINAPAGYSPYWSSSDSSQSPTEPDYDLPVGAIPGSAGVSPSGGAIYSIPVDLPLASNDMMPDLEIVYNSQSSIGILGEKWTLGGISSIVVSGRTRYYDGVYAPLNENDSLCSVYWDGQRLLSVGGEGLSADTFKTEATSNILITKAVVQYDTLFKVMTPNGITMIYGNSENSRLHYSDSVQFEWMLEKVYNRIGDTINYTYEIDTLKRQINLSKIEYGRGDDGFLNEVGFHYTRTSNLSYNQTLNYLSIDDLLLDSISMKSNNAYYGGYGFRYDTSSNRSLLQEIIQYDGEDNRYNSTKIDWETPEFNLYSNPTTKTIISGDNFEYFTGEYTGDRFDDLIATQLDSASGSYIYYLYKGSSSGLSSSYDESGNIPRSYTHDFWADLKTSVYQNCLQSSSSQFNRDDVSYILSGDFDGDGIDELMVKIMEWDVLYNFLPSNLNDGFEDTFASAGFNGFESVICNYSDQILYPDSYPMTMSSGLGKIISFDENPAADNRVRTIRLGDDTDQRPIDSYLPDPGGYGYSIIPDGGKLYYYDFKNDSLIEFSSGSGGKYWGDINADGISDYLSQVSGNWNLNNHNFKSNTFSSQNIACKDILGTIDLNGDGTSGWIAIEKDTTVTITRYNLFNLWCDENCNYLNNTVWNSFLTEFDLSDTYSNYLQAYCNDDDMVCRYNFMISDVIEVTIGGAVFIDHFDSFGPPVLIEESVIETDGFVTPKYTRSISADINSDGRNELLLFNRNRLKKIVYNFRESFDDGELEISFDSYACDIYLYDPTRTGDFNGDGNVELISPDNNSLLSFISSGKPGYYASAVTNGLGRKTDFCYKPLSDPNTYISGEKPAYPLININDPWYVVDAIVKDNGVADRDSVSYTYQGAKYHLEGKGFVGFKKTISQSHLTGRKSVSIFDTDSTYYFPYLDSSLHYVADTLISSSQYHYTINSANGKQYQLLTDSISTWNNIDNFTVSVQSTYNSTGQLITTEQRVANLASIKKSFEYTNAGWYYPYLTGKKVVQHIRNGSSMADSSYLEYNSLGQLTMKKDFWGSDKERSTLFQEYNTFGKPNRISVRGRMGLDLANDSVVKNFTYSEYGRFLASEAGPENMKTYFDVDIPSGKLIKEYSPCGLETAYQYGAFNTLEKRMSQDNIQSLSKTYWAIGHPDAPTGALYYSLEKNSASNETYTFYDVTGRDLRTVSTNFNGDKIYIDAKYDEKGRTWKTSLPYESSGSPLWTTYTYDNLGRVLQTVSADSMITENEYSPLAVETTTSKGTYASSKTIYSNALGETIQTEDADGNKVYHLYYPDGKLKATYTSVHPSDTIQLEYDILGNRTLIKDPDAGTIRSQYDDFGRMIRQINARGDTLEFDYDNLGRVTHRFDERGTTYYIYISDSTSKAFGKIDSVHCPGISQSLKLNYESTYGRLVAVSERTPWKTFTHTFSYDWFGRLMTRTYPAGLVTTYSYADNGQLKRILGNGTEVWNCEETNEFGQITSFSQGSYGTEIQFDQYGVLDEITTGSIFNMEYTRDDAGNVASREDVLTHQKELFSYDDLNRLTRVEYYLNDTHVSSSDLELTYGGDGNITSKTNVGQIINYGELTAGPHALTSVEEPADTYVPPPQVITYTDFKKVTRIVDTIAQDTTLSLKIKYGLSDQRIKSILKENDNVKRVKYFSSQFEIDSTEDGVKKYSYISSPTGLAAVFVQQGSGNDTMYYVIQDHLGNISAVINEVTDSIQYFSYSAWGQPRNPGDWTENFEAELFTDRGFTGHEHLLEFNLINMNGRVYDPVVGRFLSPDPFIAHINPNGFNRYSYVSNNPLRFTDPTGFLDRPERTALSAYPNTTPEGGPIIRNAPPHFGPPGSMPLPHNQINIGRFIRESGPIGIIKDPVTGEDITIYQDELTGRIYYVVNDVYYKDWFDVISINGFETERRFNHTQEIVKEKRVYLETAANRGGGWHAPMALPESQQAGIGEHLIGPTLIALGQPIKALKPVGALGSKGGSSIASKYLAKALPQKMGIRVMGTTVLGRALGRLVPYVGWALTINDANNLLRDYFPSYDQFLIDFANAQQTPGSGPAYTGSDGMYVCFKEGTKIYTINGLTNIEELKEGIKVYSYNFEKEELELNPIVKFFKREVTEVYIITVGKEVITVTSEHPFYVAGKGWVKVKELNVEGLLLTSKGKTKKITSITKENRTIFVYNIEVADNHNYFVSKKKVLVHNK